MPQGALSVWLPVLAWAAVIFAFSSIPSLGIGLGSWDTLLRKAAHVTEFAILGALLLRALDRELPAVLRELPTRRPTRCTSTSCGRHASPVDLLIDAVGVALGVYLLRRLQQTRPASDTGHGP